VVTQEFRNSLRLNSSVASDQQFPPTPHRHQRRDPAASASSSSAAAATTQPAVRPSSTTMARPPAMSSLHAKPAGARDASRVNVSTTTAIITTTTFVFFLFNWPILQRLTSLSSASGPR